jgi:hypothetical protein
VVAGVSSIGLLIVLKFLSDYHSSNRVACIHKEKSLRGEDKNIFPVLLLRRHNMVSTCEEFCKYVYGSVKWYVISKRWTKDKPQ